MSIGKLGYARIGRDAVDVENFSRSSITSASVIDSARRHPPVPPSIRSARAGLGERAKARSTSPSAAETIACRRSPRRAGDDPDQYGEGLMKLWAMELQVGVSATAISAMGGVDHAVDQHRTQ